MEQWGDLFFHVKEVRKKLNTQVKMYTYVFPFYVAESEFNSPIKWSFTSVIYFALNGTVPSWAEVLLGCELSDKGAVSTRHTSIMLRCSLSFNVP